MTRIPNRMGLILMLSALAGCNDKPTGGGAGTTGTPATTLKTYDAQPAVLLASRAKDGRYIVAIDFANTTAENKAVPLHERRKYVLEESIRLYAGYAKKEKADQSVELLALSVPNRDEYARGDFKNFDELAVFDTDHAKAVDENKPPIERVSKVEWRKGLSD